MTIKEQLRVLLEENRGTFISGEEIARLLYCTRGAVWKAITELRNEGCVIEAVTNRGYSLVDSGDALSAAGIRRFLSREYGEVRVLKTVGSTNVFLRGLAEKGAPEGTLVVSSEQTRGSGRRGRGFFSPADTGLYMSVLLRPAFPAQEAVRMTSAAAVAVCLALEEVCEVKPAIKWVNDICLDGRKVAGILTEAAFGIENGALEYAVVGIGLNVYPPKGGFPEEISETAGAVLPEKLPDMRNRLAAAITDNFMALYARLPDSGFLDEYRRRLMWCGEPILILSGADGSKGTPATMLGVDERCGLIVRYNDGSKGVVSSGEISIRK